MTHTRKTQKETRVPFTQSTLRLMRSGHWSGYCSAQGCQPSRTRPRWMNGVVTWPVLTTQFFAPTAVCAASFGPILVWDYGRIFPSSVASQTATPAIVPFEIKNRHKNAVRGITPCALNAESITTTSTTRLRKTTWSTSYHSTLPAPPDTRRLSHGISHTRSHSRYRTLLLIKTAAAWRGTCRRCRWTPVLARGITPCYLGSLDTSGLWTLLLILILLIFLPFLIISITFTQGDHCMIGRAQSSTGEKVIGRFFVRFVLSLYFNLTGRVSGTV